MDGTDQGMTMEIKLQENLQVAMPEYDWRAEPVGLYLHIPFCESKCIYCDFKSYAGLESKHAAFVEALCRDIAHGAAWDLPGTPGCDGAGVSTVFFGGGTPSVLTPEQI